MLLSPIFVTKRDTQKNLFLYIATLFITLTASTAAESVQENNKHPLD